MENYLFSSGMPYPPLNFPIKEGNRKRDFESNGKESSNASAPLKYTPNISEILCDGLPLVRGLSVSMDSRNFYYAA